MPLGAHNRLRFEPVLLLEFMERFRADPAAVQRQHVVIPAAAELQELVVKRQVAHADAAEPDRRLRLFSLDRLVTGLQQIDEIPRRIDPEAGETDQVRLVPELVTPDLRIAAHDLPDEIPPVIEIFRRHGGVFRNEDVDPVRLRTRARPARRAVDVEGDAFVREAVLPGEPQEIVNAAPVDLPRLLLHTVPAESVDADRVEADQPGQRNRVLIHAEMRRRAEVRRNIGRVGRLRRSDGESVAGHRKVAFADKRVFAFIDRVLPPDSDRIVLRDGLAVHLELRLVKTGPGSIPAPAFPVENRAGELLADRRLSG